MREVFIVKSSKINKEFDADFYLVPSKLNITYSDMILTAKYRFFYYGGDYVWLGNKTSITWLRIKQAFLDKAVLNKSEMEILFKVLNLKFYDY